jgi:3-oxoacyl-[acyl-carrier protein] reductase
LITTEDDMATTTTTQTDPSELPLAGQWAVVTGGSMGIGRAIAERFIEGGANVVMVARGRPTLDEAVEGAKAIAGPGQDVIGLTADVSAREGIDALFAELRSRLPVLNIFVANAGTGQVTPFLELTVEEFESVLALNFTGTLYCCQQAGRMMAENPQPNSAIVLVSSIRALGARPGRLIYSATKAGVNMAVRVAATELAPMGIRVNTLSPGITETPLTAKNPEAFNEAVANVPLGRAGQPSDLAEAAYFLCSPKSSFITGINLIVDGGESLTS